MIDPTAFIHPAAIVTGNVTLGKRVSVWPTAVIRGDSDTIEIGDDSNVQDGTIIHVDDGIPTASASASGSVIARSFTARRSKTIA